MTQYTLYKSSDLSNPLVVINENTIDDTTTSVFLIGKRKESYGQPEQQSKVWMLENFANSTAPAHALKGQLWFNTNDNKLYVCNNAGSQTFEKAGKPIVSNTTPSTGIIATGDLWFNTSDNILYVYNGAQWVNASSGVAAIPSTVQQEAYLTGTTTDGTATEIFIGGVSGTRLAIELNTSWLFEINVVGRRNTNTSEVYAAKFTGIFDKPNASPVNFVAGFEKNIFGRSGALASTVDATLTADTVHDSLKVSVTGEASKTIQWVATVKYTIVAN